MTEKTFAVVSNILSSMPSSQPWDDRIGMAYAIAMKSWDDKLTERAVMKALMTRKWRPTPCELREIALQIKRVVVPSPQAQEQIKHIVLHYPSHERREAADKLISEGRVSPMVPAIVKYLGGWGRIGDMTDDKLERAVEGVMEEAMDDPEIESELGIPMRELGESKQVRMIGA